MTDWRDLVERMFEARREWTPIGIGFDLDDMAVAEGYSHWHKREDNPRAYLFDYHSSGNIAIFHLILDVDPTAREGPHPMGDEIIVEYARKPTPFLTVRRGIGSDPGIVIDNDSFRINSTEGLEPVAKFLEAFTARRSSA